MGEHPYREWFGSPELCPALDIQLAKPQDTKPLLELPAAFDTGSPLTAIPLIYKDTCKLVPARKIKVRWPGYFEGSIPTYIVRLTIDGYTPRLVEIVYDPTHEDYALIGRNLMNYWYATLKGPERILEITES